MSTSHAQFIWHDLMSTDAKASLDFYAHVYFVVDGIDAALERMKAKGGELLHGPSEVPGGGWMLQARDPQGGLFALTSPTR